MNKAQLRDTLLNDLSTWGSDFSRWPQDRVSGARETILQDRDIRRAWEAERNLDRAIARHKEQSARDLEASGALERVRRRALARVPVQVSRLGWHRIAAAMLLAGALGGVMDVYFARPLTGTADLVMLDPVYGLSDTEMQ